jgi:hypothetical protein
MKSHHGPSIFPGSAILAGVRAKGVFLPVSIIVGTLFFTLVGFVQAQEVTFSSGNLGFTDIRSMGSIGAPVSLFVTHSGSVTSQGDAAMNANLARSNFGVSGTGIKVGVISDSFDLSGTNYLVDQASNDLPGPNNTAGYTTAVNVLKDDTYASLTDEGRAMAQIIHDVAPGAEIMFHSAFNNFTGGSDLNSIANAIDALRVAGANVIVDDVGLLNQPFFQDGVTAQAVNNAKAAGIAYFSSAGNSGNQAYKGTFDGASGGFHDFDANNSEGGDTALNIAVADGYTARVAVQWSDPYPSVAAPGNAADFDVGLYDFDAGEFADTSARNQGAGDDPWEIVSVTNTSGADKQYGLQIQHYSGETNRQLKAVVFGSGAIADDDDTNSPALFGHAAAEGGVAVAANRYSIPGSVESFSSRGPTEILFDPSGNPISEIRDTPLLTAPDGVSTTVSGFGTFYGTSAAAPHAAAVAALVLERANNVGKTLSVDELYQTLFDSAVDIEGAGYDNLSGWGRVDADAAVASVFSSATIDVTPESRVGTDPLAPVVRNSGETISVENTAVAGSDNAKLSNVNIATEAAYGNRFSYTGAQFVDDQLIAPGQTVVATIGFDSSNLLNGVTVTGTFSFNALGDAAAAEGEAGTHAYNLSATVSGNTGGGSAIVGGGQSYAGLASTSDETLASTATLKGGANDNGASETIDMSWRPADAGNEVEGVFVSDVVDLTGIGGGDIFILEMSWDPAKLIADANGVDSLAEAQAFAESGKVFVMTNQGDAGSTAWIHAADATSQGDLDQAALFHGVEDSFDQFVTNGLFDPDNLTTGDLGEWGIVWNEGNGTYTAFIITDHNSEFAVVPEPSTLVLAIIGLFFIAGWRRRK